MVYVANAVARVSWWKSGCVPRPVAAPRNPSAPRLAPNIPALVYELAISTRNGGNPPKLCQPLYASKRYSNIAVFGNMLLHSRAITWLLFSAVFHAYAITWRLLSPIFVACSIPLLSVEHGGHMMVPILLFFLFPCSNMASMILNNS